MTDTKKPTLIPYWENNKWGYCNRDKIITIPCIFDSARPFIDSYAQVKIGSKYGLIDRKGNFTDKEVAGDFIYNASRWNESRKKTKLQRIDIPFLQQGEKNYIRFIEDEIDRDLYAVKCSSKWGFMDEYGDEIIPYIYDEVLPFSEGFAGVCKNKSWNFINKQGENLLSPYSKERFGVFQQIDSFSEGFAAVALYREDLGECECGYIDYKGNYLLENNRGFNLGEFTHVTTFNRGLAYVEIAEVNHMSPSDGYIVVGYIDREGTKYWHKMTPWSTFERSSFLS